VHPEAGEAQDAEGEREGRGHHDRARRYVTDQLLRPDVLEGLVVDDERLAVRHHERQAGEQEIRPERDDERVQVSYGDQQAVEEPDHAAGGHTEQDRERHRYSSRQRPVTHESGHDEGDHRGQVDPAADEDDRRERGRDTDQRNGRRDVEQVALAEEELVRETQVDEQRQRDQGQRELGPQ
jgi:hypothetical protein